MHLFLSLNLSLNSPYPFYWASSRASTVARHRPNPKYKQALLRTYMASEGEEYFQCIPADTAMLRELNMTRVSRPCLRRNLATVLSLGDFTNLDTPNSTPLMRSSARRRMYMMLKLLRKSENKSNSRIMGGSWEVSSLAWTLKPLKALKERKGE